MKKTFITLIGISVFIFTGAGTAGSTQITEPEWDMMRFKNALLSELTLTEHGLRLNPNGLTGDVNDLATLALSHLGNGNLFGEYTAALTQLIRRNTLNTLTVTRGDSVEPSTTFQAFISAVTQNLSNPATDPAQIFMLMSEQFQQTIGREQIIQSIQEMLHTDSPLSNMDGQIIGDELAIQINRNLYRRIEGMFQDGTAPEDPATDQAPVPEPATFLLLGLGLGTLHMRRNRKRRRL